MAYYKKGSRTLKARKIAAAKRLLKGTGVIVRKRKKSTSLFGF